MRVITEAELRDQYQQAEFTSYRMPAGTRLTPSAQQFLNERRIKIVTDTQNIDPEAGMAGTRAETDGTRTEPEKDGTTPLAVRDSAYGHPSLGGQKPMEKPEHMTHINGKKLVPKSHPRIRFRGKLDYLQALLIGIIIDVEGYGYREMARDLAGVLKYLMQIMSAEVREQPLDPLDFHGLSQAEIREQSQHPDRFFGISHIFPQPGNGKLMAQLNLLRTEVRELELAALDAFHGQPEGQDRPDIIQSLNRLSSLVYVFMLRLASSQYRVGG